MSSIHGLHRILKHPELLIALLFMVILAVPVYFYFRARGLKQSASLDKTQLFFRKIGWVLLILIVICMIGYTLFDSFA